MSKGWTEERRKAQAERCRANKPWERSTGPRTAEGKVRSSMNAFKNGGRAAEYKMIKEMNRNYHAFLLYAKAYLKNEVIKNDTNQHVNRIKKNMEKTK